MFLLSYALVPKNLFNQRKPWLINYLRAYKAPGRPGLNRRDTLHDSRDTNIAFTTVERALQIRPFMQNKANFRKSQMNVNKVLTKDYEQIDTWSIGKNKANSKPIQTQFKANTNPIQTQFKAKQTQCLSAISAAGQRQKMLMRLTIKPRRKPLGHYPDWTFFADDLGPNLPCFVGLLFDQGPIFSEKKQQLREIPDKAGAVLCRFVYIRKSLHLQQEQWIISVDFRLIIEDKHW